MSQASLLPTAAGDSDPEQHGFGELRSGQLGVRLATSPAEIDAVQALRYRVFYSEMGAHPSPDTLASGRDRDLFDQVADHLVVIDHARGDGAEAVVGTYRLIRQEAVASIGHFYSAAEYDLRNLISFPGRLLELGRSCVDPAYRGRAAMQLMWRGLAAYVFRNDIALMFGCASLHGTDPDALATELSYLYHHHLAPPALRPVALPDRYVEMRRIDPAKINPRKAVLSLPPLIKGYLRLGAYIGDGAVIDAQFNTIDVAVIVKTDLVTERYNRHYRRDSTDPS